MTPKSIERALARYRAYKDEDVRNRLTLFGPLMLKAAELANTMGEDDVKFLREPTDAEILEAGRGGETLLSRGLVAINPESFGRNLALMGETLLASLKGDDAFNAAAKAFDWTPFASGSFVSRASRSPLEALAAAEGMTEGVNANLLDMWVLPVLGMTLRAYLDAFGGAVSRRLLGPPHDVLRVRRRARRGRGRLHPEERQRQASLLRLLRRLLDLRAHPLRALRRRRHERALLRERRAGRHAPPPRLRELPRRDADALRRGRRAHLQRRR